MKHVFVTKAHNILQLFTTSTKQNTEVSQMHRCQYCYYLLIPHTHTQCDGGERLVLSADLKGEVD